MDKVSHKIKASTIDNKVNNHTIDNTSITIDSDGKKIQEKYDMQVRNMEMKWEKYGKKIWEILMENKRNSGSDGKKIGEI